MAQIFEATVTDEAVGLRLDRFLSERFDLTRSAAERLLSEGAVAVCGGQAAKNYRLRGGEQITLSLPDPTPDVEPEPPEGELPGPGESPEDAPDSGSTPAENTPAEPPVPAETPKIE